MFLPFKHINMAIEYLVPTCVTEKYIFINVESKTDNCAYLNQLPTFELSTATILLLCSVPQCFDGFTFSTTGIRTCSCP